MLTRANATAMKKLRLWKLVELVTCYFDQKLQIVQLSTLATKLSKRHVKNNGILTN